MFHHRGPRGGVDASLMGPLEKGGKGWSIDGIHDTMRCGLAQA